MRRLLPLILPPLLAVATPGVAAGTASPGGEPAARSDFNGDGFPDLAIGVSSEDFHGELAAGAVTVLYSSADGLTTQGGQWWHQDQPDVDDQVEQGDVFGHALSAGDFDGDGFGDLAVGVPFEDLGGIEDAGAVNVLYGSPTGLAAARDQFWHQDVDGVVDMAEPFDEFGFALASGDFDGDGFVDLAVGVDGEGVKDADVAGAANILHGSPSGLTVAGDQLWHQARRGIRGAAGFANRFGYALAAGDYDSDGFDDLAVGVPFDSEIVEGAGVVNVLYGSADGITADRDRLWHQGLPGVLDEAEDNDTFGVSVAAGDFDGDGFVDLAIGANNEDVIYPSAEEGGAVNVLYGSASGLTAAGDQFWHQGQPGVEEEVDEADDFGREVRAGDFDGDGFADLAIGVAEDLDPVGNGAVNVLYGSSSGLTADGDQLWHEGVPGVPGEPANSSGFGDALAAADLDGDGFAELAIGAPFQSVGGEGAAGAVIVLIGSSDGLSATGSQFLHQRVAGIPDRPQEGDEFGFALAAGG